MSSRSKAHTLAASSSLSSAEQQQQQEQEGGGQGQWTRSKRAVDDSALPYAGIFDSLKMRFACLVCVCSRICVFM